MMRWAVLYWPWEGRDVTISEREEEDQCGSVLFGLEVKWTENEYIFLQQHQFPWTWGFGEPILNKSTVDSYIFLSCFEMVATISKIEETVSPVYGGSSTGLWIHRWYISLKHLNRLLISLTNRYRMMQDLKVTPVINSTEWSISTHLQITNAGEGIRKGNPPTLYG